jgi:MoaA/NifB/PqqE/SkfB family radical SAM enzyme
MDSLTARYFNRPDPEPKVQWAHVDEEGRLVLPPALAAQLGLTPGAPVRIEPLGNGLKLHRPVTHLAKVYVEPTNLCNLDCITCFRQGWDEPPGSMTDETFAAVLRGLDDFDPLPAVYFGGIGEPLAHPRILEWVARAHAKGARTELITNGILLDERMSRALIEAGLDLLWVSIDGASPEAYADVRIGAEVGQVLANVDRFSRMRKPGHHPRPELGIAFVAMRRNIGELPALLRLGQDLRVKYFSVSNVLPVTPDLLGDRLYARTKNDPSYIAADKVPSLSLPKMDFSELTREALFQAFQSGYNVSYAGNNWSGANDVCNFVENGTTSVVWDGDVSPCWPLMHTHRSYLHDKPRINHGHRIGNVRERPLRDLWLDPDYVAYRERLQSFAFPPCTFCGGCEVSTENLEDCVSNPEPVCGGCLWAQGVIQCP